MRKKQNISQADMAEAMNVSRQAVSKWESDKSCPDTLKLIQLAEYLNTEVEYLATGRHPVYKSPDIHITLLKKEEQKESQPPLPSPVPKPQKHTQQPIIKHIIRTRYKYRTDPKLIFWAAVFGSISGFLLGLIF